MPDIVPPPAKSTSETSTSPWLTVKEGCQRARVGPKLFYREIRAGRLRAARIGGRREYRLLAEWIDDWLLSTSEPIEVSRGITYRVSR